MRRSYIAVVATAAVLVGSAFFTFGGNQAQAEQSHIQNVIISGDTVIGEISDRTPAPEFLIAANPGDVLSIDVVGIDNVDPIIRILDGNNEVIAQGQETGAANHMRAELYVLRSDRFAIQVQSSTRENGEFAITVITQEGQEGNQEDTVLEIPQLDIGETMTGMVNAEQPMQFITLDYSSTEPLMLVISSPTYLPPVMVENTMTRQLVGQVMPPIHAGMLCMAPGMHSHRVDVMYSGVVPEQTYELTLQPPDHELSQWCGAQGAAAATAQATSAPSAFSPDLFNRRPDVDTTSLKDTLTNDGGSTGGVPPGIIDDTTGGGTGSGTTGGDSGGTVSVDACAEADISLCVNGNVGSGTAGANVDGNVGDNDINVDGNVDNGTAGVNVDGNVGDNGINVDANADDGGVNVDGNAGDTNIHVGSSDGGVTVDTNAGGQDTSVDSNNVVEDVVDGVGGLLGGE